MHTRRRMYCTCIHVDACTVHAYTYTYVHVYMHVLYIAETTAFERYGVKTSEKANMHNDTGLPQPRLARSAHPGRKLLRGYVSKSSAALNPLTIT